MHSRSVGNCFAISSSAYVRINTHKLRSITTATGKNLARNSSFIPLKISLGKVLLAYLAQNTFFKSQDFFFSEMTFKIVLVSSAVAVHRFNSVISTVIISLLAFFTNCNLSCLAISSNIEVIIGISL
jgi:hypothetical protein